MFLKARRGDTRNGQWACGPFLAVFTKEGCKYNYLTEIRALVRVVKLTQLGHFMMGTMSVPKTVTGEGSYKLTCSGTYGADGLTNDAKDADKIWDGLWPLPEDLAYLFWTSNGHNDAGAHGRYIHSWATKNHAALRRPKPADLKLYDYRLRFFTKESSAALYGEEDSFEGWGILMREKGLEEWVVYSTYALDSWEYAGKRLNILRERQNPVQALDRYKAERKEQKRATK